MLNVNQETYRPQTSPSLLGRLLRIADGYFDSGALKQASEMYFELAEQNATSAEGGRARQQLIVIAETYERQGLQRQARSIYDRLMEA